MRFAAGDPTGCARSRDIERKPVGVLEAGIINEVIGLALSRLIVPVGILKIGVKRPRLCLRADNAYAQRRQKPFDGEGKIIGSVGRDPPDRMGVFSCPVAGLVAEQKRRLAQFQPPVFQEAGERCR